MSGYSKVEQLAATLRARLDASTPEQIVTDLFQLNVMRGEFQIEELYRSVFRTMVEKLYLKTSKGTW